MFAYIECEAPHFSSTQETMKGKLQRTMLQRMDMLIAFAWFIMAAAICLPKMMQDVLPHIILP